jgi:hypothetical protein
VRRFVMSYFHLQKKTRSVFIGRLLERWENFSKFSWKTWRDESALRYLEDSKTELKYDAKLCLCVLWEAGVSKTYDHSSEPYVFIERVEFLTK